MSKRDFFLLFVFELGHEHTPSRVFIDDQYR